MMKREDRAKQFAPFESLDGLRRALAEKELEHERVEKTELSEDRTEHIGKILAKLDRGTRVKITYYDRGYYVDVSGEVREVDKNFGYIRLGGGKVFFDDIYEIKIE